MDSSTKTMRAESTEQTAQLNDSEGTEAQRQVHSEKMLMRKMEWEVRCQVKGQPPRVLIGPTFSDADQLMYSTVTLATWKDNAVLMSRSVMEANERQNKHHGNTSKYI